MSDEEYTTDCKSTEYRNSTITSTYSIDLSDIKSVSDTDENTRTNCVEKTYVCVEQITAFLMFCVFGLFCVIAVVIVVIIAVMLIKRISSKQTPMGNFTPLYLQEDLEQYSVTALCWLCDEDDEENERRNVNACKVAGTMVFGVLAATYDFARNKANDVAVEKCTDLIMERGTFTFTFTKKKQKVSITSITQEVFKYDCGGVCRAPKIGVGEKEEVCRNGGAIKEISAPSEIKAMNMFFEILYHVCVNANVDCFPNLESIKCIKDVENVYDF